MPDNEEKVRVRDLVLQVKRFLKYAPKGTSSLVLCREAIEFERRLSNFRDGFDSRTVHQLLNELRKIYRVD